MIAYVAGPLTFTEAGRLYERRMLAPILRKSGYKLAASWASRSTKLVSKIYFREDQDQKVVWRCLLNGEWTNTMRLIDRANLVLAVLDGAPPDNCLRTEVEYALLKSKRLVGFSTDLRRGFANPGWRQDRTEALIRESGGKVVRSLAELGAEIAPSAEIPKLKPSYSLRTTQTGVSSDIPARKA